MKKNFLAAIAVSVSLFGLSSCLDSDLKNVDVLSLEAATKEALASNECEPVFSAVDGLISSFNASASSPQLSAKQKVAEYPEKYVTYLSPKGVYPEECLVDFGTDGYTNSDGVTFKGQVNRKIDSTITVYTFMNLYVNDNFVQGSRVVERINSSDLKITTTESVVFKNDSTSSRTSERIRIVVDNKNDTIYWNDDYEFTGFTKGINTEGEEYSMVITKPFLAVCLTKDRWKYFVKGSFTTTTSIGSRVVDFGNGEIDNLADVITTIDGEVIPSVWEMKW